MTEGQIVCPRPPTRAAFRKRMNDQTEHWGRPSLQRRCGHGRDVACGPIKRKDGDYLYHQDREKFEVDYKEWCDAWMKERCPWKKDGQLRWVRSDGAVVKWDDSSPWPNPAKESARMWTAWEPDPSESYLRRGSKRGIGWPRRWKHPERAMQEVDRLFPLATT